MSTRTTRFIIRDNANNVVTQMCLLNLENVTTLLALCPVKGSLLSVTVSYTPCLKSRPTALSLPAAQSALLAVSLKNEAFNRFQHTNARPPTGSNLLRTQVVTGERTGRFGPAIAGTSALLGLHAKPGMCASCAPTLLALAPRRVLAWGGTQVAPQPATHSLRRNAGQWRVRRTTKGTM